MTEQTSDERFPFSLRTVLWCVLVIAVLVFLCSGGFERIFFPVAVFSKDSFTPAEEATLTAPLELKMPQNARVAMASYHKRFGPGGGTITVCLKIPADETGVLLKGNHVGTVYRPIGCPLPEWREARKTIETAYMFPFYIYVSKPIDGEVGVYYEYEDYDGRSFQILSKGKRRTALPRERSD